MKIVIIKVIFIDTEKTFINYIFILSYKYLSKNFIKFFFFKRNIYFNLSDI